MEKEEAMRISGMEAREYPNARFEYMRCQLGRYVPEKVYIGRYKYVTEQVWHLKACGESFEAALKQLRDKRR